MQRQAYMAHLSAPELLDRLKVEERAREVIKNLAGDIEEFYRKQSTSRQNPVPIRT